MNRLEHFIFLSLLLVVIACSPTVHTPTMTAYLKEQKTITTPTDTFPEDSLIAWMGPHLPPPPPPPPPPPHIVVGIQRTYCYGRCPVYEAEIYSDGQVLYRGKRHVKLLGNWEAQVDTATYEGIIQQARQIKYFKMSNQYPNYGPVMTDFPTTVTYVADGEAEKTVNNRHGSPVALQRFERAIDKLLDGLNWKKYVEKPKESDD